MKNRLPPNVTLAIRELCRPYLPDLAEGEIAARLSAPAPSDSRSGDGDRLLTVPTAAKFLGVCRATVGNMLRDNQLHRVKIRGACRIRQSELDALAAGREIARAGE